MRFANVIGEIAAAVADAAAISNGELDVVSARVSLAMRLRFSREGDVSIGVERPERRGNVESNAARLVLTMRRDHA